MPLAAEIYYHLYADRGESLHPPVVLIHGAGGTHLVWPPEIRKLPGYRVYALDLPGHGKSGGRGFQSISAYAQAILEWMDAIGIHRAVFVGHSMGSAIAANLELEHPVHVAGLTLIGSGVRLRVSPELLESAASPTTFHRTVEMIVSWSFCEKSPARLIELASRRMEEGRSSVLHGDLLACNAFNEMERISMIRSPTLILCGINDRMTPVRYSQYMAANISGAKLKSIPDAGHMVMLEKPKEVAKALLDFLPEVSY
jgi:pimeloyl-ACP methyl ester carboxylesterase